MLHASAWAQLLNLFGATTLRIPLPSQTQVPIFTIWSQTQSKDAKAEADTCDPAIVGKLYPLVSQPIVES